MSDAQASPRGESHGGPARPLEWDGARSRSPALIDLSPALIVLLVPLVVVPLAWAFVSMPAEEDGGLPVWAVEAFGADRLRAALAVPSLPAPVLLLYGLVALASPPAGAMLGLGTLGRWAALAGFSLGVAILGGLLAIGLLLGLVAPNSASAGVRLQVLAGLAWPLFALEACGCLLAASCARESLSSRRTHTTPVR